MNRAVMRPHAMNAAMLGMIMPLRNVPNLCTPTLALPPAGADVDVGDVVVMCISFCVEGCCSGVGSSRGEVFDGLAGTRRVVGRERETGRLPGALRGPAGEFVAHLGKRGRRHR